MLAGMDHTMPKSTCVLDLHLVGQEGEGNQEHRQECHLAGSGAGADVTIACRGASRTTVQWRHFDAQTCHETANDRGW